MDYCIAGAVIRLEGLPADPTGFSPFRQPEGARREPHCTIHMAMPAAYQPLAQEAETIDRFTAGGYRCVFGRLPEGYTLSVSPPVGEPLILWQAQDGGFFSNAAVVRGADPTALSFMLWVACGLALLPLGAVALHSSAVVCRSRSVLFLGESGTGKSTHTRLWFEHIGGTHLLNDDSPIVGLSGDVATAWGSPWSGKTAVHLNERFPIAAVVRLSQATHNTISRLNRLEAFGALLPSCPPPFAKDDRLTDSLCGIISDVIGLVPVFHLECRPDESAARLVYKTVFGDGENDTK